jgi:hypothetical protein
MNIVIYKIVIILVYSKKTINMKILTWIIYSMFIYLKFIYTYLVVIIFKLNISYKYTNMIQYNWLKFFSYNKVWNKLCSHKNI